MKLENEIATRVNLKRCEIVVENLLCNLCEIDDESCSHLFFKCRLA